MTDKYRREAIRAYCTDRQIHTLVHFTRLENLAGILADGILPRTSLEEQKRRITFNDATRADGHKDAVCLSVSFPNYRMFYKYRFVDQTSTWAVLQIRADVLWDLDCAFCWANAACSAISKLPLGVLKDSTSLSKMFAEQCELTGTSRAEIGVPDSYPTNPQAEVLAFLGVPQSYITTVCFNNQRDKSKFVAPIGVRLDVELKPTFFSARSDYQVWNRVGKASPGDQWQDAPSSVPF